MNKRYTILIVAVVFIALPVLAIVQRDSFSRFVGQTKPDLENCTSEIEGLKLCTSASKIIVNSGDAVRIKLSWVNLTNEDRIILRASSYKATITDEKGEKLIPVLQRKTQEGSMTKEDFERQAKRMGGSYTSIHIDANQAEPDEVRLTEAYDYDLTAKGKYHVSIEKIVPSVDKKTQVTFSLDDIEIEVK